MPGMTIHRGPKTIRIFRYSIGVMACLLIKSSSIGQVITSCSTLPPSALKTAYISYIRLGGVIGNHFRFIDRITMECGTPVSLNPLYVIEPEKSNAVFASAAWQFDSSFNITSVKDPCLATPQQPCYSVYYYHADVDLNYNQFGYIAATFDCCRPPAMNLYNDGVNNFHYETPKMVETAADTCTPNVGANFAYNGIASFVKIPPFSQIEFNNTPQFTSIDTVLFLCKGRPFSYQLVATDADGDSIAFHFSASRTFRLKWDPACANSPYCGHFIQTAPPYPLIDYHAPTYSVNQPAGKDVSLDPLNGMIQGVINDTGTYVVPVSALEFRDGKMIDSVTKEVLIRVYDCAALPPPKASIPSIINSCNDFTVSFPNNSFPLYASRVENTTFQWDFGDEDTSDQIYPSHRYADTGDYRIRLIVFPGLYCADTAFSNVLVYPYLKVSFTADDSCSNKDIHFTNTSVSTGGIINYTKWLIKLDNSVLDSSLQYNTDFTFIKKPKTYTVLLTVGTDKGCIATDTGMINIFPSPLPLTSHDTVVTRNANIQLMANDGAGGLNGQFDWSPPTGLSDPHIADPILTSNANGTYYVSMKNYYGCTLKDSIHITYFTGPDIYVPNAFTPNGDGRNDVFRPFMVGISRFSYFKVFDRYGRLVFQTEQDKKGWDGSVNGKPSSPGTYVWEARGIDFNGKTIFRKGTVVLLR